MSMKTFLSFSLLILTLNLFAQKDNDVKQDKISTTGIFEGTYIAKSGYKINDYYISDADITAKQVDSLKGKRVHVSGKLKMVKGNDGSYIQSTADDRKFIVAPVFTIIWDAREPLIDND